MTTEHWFLRLLTAVNFVVDGREHTQKNAISLRHTYGRAKTYTNLFFTNTYRTHGKLRFLITPSLFLAEETRNRFHEWR